MANKAETRNNYVLKLVCNVINVNRSKFFVDLKRASNLK